MRPSARQSFGNERPGYRIEVRVTWEKGDAQPIRVESSAEAELLRLLPVGTEHVERGPSWLDRSSGGCADRGTLGIVPLGTANDFATGCGIPS